jgi:hypothetical protein
MKLVKIISLAFMISFNIINSADRGTLKVLKGLQNLARNKQLHNSIKNQFSNNTMKIGKKDLKAFLDLAENIEFQRKDFRWAMIRNKDRGKSFESFYGQLVELEKNFQTSIRDLNKFQELELLRIIENQLELHKNDVKVIDELNLLKKYIRDVKNHTFLSFTY